MIIKQILVSYKLLNSFHNQYLFANLPKLQSSNIPKLYLKSQKQIMLNWWSQKPFEIKDKMHVPIFKFKDGQYTGQSIQLPQDTFNCPLRRDLLHRLYNYRINLNKFTTKRTRNRAMTAGSGRKMRLQKGMGRARMGDKRAPHLRKGGKAHGSKPKVYSFPLNGKIKLKALKTLLTAKLVEGKLKIIDSEMINEAKTKILAKTLKFHTNSQQTLFYLITDSNPNQNFYLGKNNIPTLKTANSYNLDVLWLFKADKILITVKGLEQLLENMSKTQQILYSNKSFEETKDQEQISFQKPYQFKFPILAQYLSLYKKMKQQNSQQNEKLKTKQTQ